MNLKSAKFGTLKRGKLSTRQCFHVLTRQIYKFVNFPRCKLSAVRIEYAKALNIGKFDLGLACLSRKQVGNWLRPKFPVLKIETVENGSIRQ